MLLKEWLVFGMPLDVSSDFFSILIDDAAFGRLAPPTEVEAAGPVQFPARKDVFGGVESHLVVL